MVSRVNRYPVITGVTLAAVAVATGLLLWFILANTASATTVTTQKLHGEFADIQINPSPNAFGFAAANTNGVGKDRQTFVNYDTFIDDGDPSNDNFGFGQIPNEDFNTDRKGNPTAATLNTHTSRITNGGVFGASGPISFDITANGFGNNSFSGKQSFGFGGFEVQDSGSASSQTADGSGTIINLSGSTTGPGDANVGFQRINERTITTP